MASTQIERIARETGAVFRWQPVSSRALLGRRSDEPFKPGAPGQYDWDYRKRDTEARTLGLDLARLESGLDSPELAQEHEQRILEVESRGAFGRPFFTLTHNKIELVEPIGAWLVQQQEAWE